ncbi:hypothetical protein [Bailinhaonella thermotolerans]|uniref:Lipoprotein n=1 Tax=Bailinhaonella thermotolerans TaxID=1070861 RepID=A0A3A4AQV4_9ACTN|nr:hypothetical protein [Bailinhaonella thermotolerans]RJL30989.1 hypothetical protein D5H75_22170 [Bailinhaonella thermotolerans]
MKLRIALAALLLVSACGGTAPASEVASAGGTKTPASPAAKGSGDDPMLAHAKCMRREGVADYPDPGSPDQGKYSTPPPDEAVRVRYEKAMKACMKEMEAGREAAPPPDAAELDRLTKYAECYRKRGIEVKGPDPSNGEIRFGAASEAEHDAAEKACSPFRAGK